MLAIRCCDLFGASGPTRLLIDCGDVDEDDARRYVDRLEAVMRQHGVTGLAGVIATHAHIDHIGGMGLCLPLPLTFHPLTTHHPPPPPLPPGITHPPLHPRTIPPTACAVPFVPAAPPMPFFVFFSRSPIGSNQSCVRTQFPEIPIFRDSQAAGAVRRGPTFSQVADRPNVAEAVARVLGGR